MMRSAGFGFTILPGTSYFTYSFGKQLNNVIHLNNPWMNIAGEANWNSPASLSYWYYGEDGSVTLEKLFYKAIEECNSILECFQ
jgi:hypothetical protein